MDWVESIPYLQFLKQASLREHLEYLLSLLNTISILHSIGIYHHDIKPSNFLYNSQTKRGVLIDYGTMLIVKDTYSRTKLSIQKAKPLHLYLRKNNSSPYRG